MASGYRQNVLWMAPALAASVRHDMDSPEMTFSRKFGATLIELRMRAGISSQALLSERLRKRGVAASEPTVRRWEAGDALPDAWALNQLCEVLGCDADELVNPAEMTDREIEVLRRSRKASRRALGVP